MPNQSVEQLEICQKYGSRFDLPPSHYKLGVSRNVQLDIYPIHGLRHPVDGDTSGWYIWSGEYSEEADFFLPLHIHHINEWNPLIEKYLALEPGWRFLIAHGHEDVWFDEKLLNI